MTKEDALNILIKDKYVDINKISDGYHTFGELYEHRIELFIAVCRIIATHIVVPSPWRSTHHSDGTQIDGWFILGLWEENGKQISYHLPVSKWNECDFAKTLERAPEFDGHTSSDVLQRLKEL